MEKRLAKHAARSRALAVSHHKAGSARQLSALDSYRRGAGASILRFLALADWDAPQSPQPSVS